MQSYFGVKCCSVVCIGQIRNSGHRVDSSDVISHGARAIQKAFDITTI